MSLTTRPLDRVRLRRAAARYTAHGWHVVPGAAFTGERFRCDDLGCPTWGSHPATERWEQVATSDTTQTDHWWRRMPYAVLMPTGRAFDVLDVPTHLGLPVARNPVRGPVAVTPSGRWMFLVRPGDPLRPELASQLDVVLHGRGSWVAAPPTRDAIGRVRWAVSPDEVDWRLPDSYEVQALLVTAQLPLAGKLPLAAKLRSAAARAAVGASLAPVDRCDPAVTRVRDRVAPARVTLHRAA